MPRSPTPMTARLAMSPMRMSYHMVIYRPPSADIIDGAIITNIPGGFPIIPVAIETALTTIQPLKNGHLAGGCAGPRERANLLSPPPRVPIPARRLSPKPAIADQAKRIRSPRRKKIRAAEIPTRTKGANANHEFFIVFSRAGTMASHRLLFLFIDPLTNLTIGKEHVTNI